MPSKRRDAKKLLKKASALEAEGRFQEAIALYSKCYKMCPELDTDADSGENAAQLKFLREHQYTAKEMADLSFDASELAQDVNLRVRFREQLRHQGFAVVDNVLSAEEVAHAREDLNAFLAGYGISSSSAESLSQFFADPITGTTSRGGCAHSHLCWSVRSNLRIQKLFKVAYGASADNKEVGEEDEKYLTSFEGIWYFPNPEATKDGYGGATVPLLHSDASDVEVTGELIRAMANLHPCLLEQDPGIVFLPRSHIHLFPEMLSIKNERRMERKQKEEAVGGRDVDNQENDDEEVEGVWFDDECVDVVLDSDLKNEVIRRLSLKAGSVVFWKSSLLHSTIGAQARSSERCNHEEALRGFGVFLTMAPAARAFSPEELQIVSAAREHLLQQGLATSFNPLSHQKGLRGSGPYHIVGGGDPSLATYQTLESLPNNGRKLM